MLEDLLINQENLDPQAADENPNETYRFATGELAPSEQLDAFMEEFALNKEEKNAPEGPTPEELAELENDPENEEEISNETARNTAQFIVTTIDEGASMGLAYLSKEKQDDFRAGREQRKNLENLFTKFCKEKGTEIPLPWQIFFCLATIYGAKVPYALDRRAINKEREEIEKTRKALEEERLKLSEAYSQIESERKALRSIREQLKEPKKKNDGE